MVHRQTGGHGDRDRDKEPGEIVWHMEKTPLARRDWCEIPAPEGICYAPAASIHIAI